MPRGDPVGHKNIPLGLLRLCLAMTLKYYLSFEIMIDIRQSPQYADYLKSYGWIIEKAGQWNIFIKKFPLIGSLLKIQRISPPIPFAEIKNLGKKHHAFKTIIEFSSGPLSPQSPQSPLLPQNYKICRSPFLPTKTLVLDLKKSEKEIFDCLPKEKKRLLKRIQEKKEIIIKEGTAEDFIKIKSRGLLEKNILPLGVKKEINTLWQSFFPDNIKILIAYQCHSRESRNLYKYLYRFRIPTSHSFAKYRLVPGFAGRGKSGMTIIPIAAALFLFYDKKAYYWQAASTKQGKKLSAPSLLVWEGIKIAKKLKGEVFDFEGIFDERFPIESWKGFSHFKKEFGGEEINFSSPLSSSKFPLIFL